VRQANILQVEVDVSLTNGVLVLPVGLLGYETSNSGQVSDSIGTCVSFVIPELQVQFRLHDYFMGKSLILKL
jgi:hypothetical protein